MSLNDKSVAGALLQTVKKYIDKHISILTTSLNNKNKTKRFKVSKGATSVATGTPFITNESLISFDRIIGNPATSIANIGVDGDYFVESGTIHFKEFNKDIVISCGVNYGVHDISHADVLGQGTTENDISVMKHELDMLSGSGIGHNGIYYIQDVGSKEAGKIYLDKTQEGVWKCLNTTSSINNTSDFERIDNTTLDDKLRNLENTVVDVSTIAGCDIYFSRNGRVHTVSLYGKITQDVTTDVRIQMPEFMLLPNFPVETVFGNSLIPGMGNFSISYITGMVTMHIGANTPPLNGKLVRSIITYVA